VLMSLHSVRSIVHVYVSDVITETTTAHGNSDARSYRISCTMQFRCNKRSQVRLQEQASRDVLNAISISPRGSAVSSRYHATATCVKYYFSDPCFIKLQNNINPVFPTSLLHNIVSILQALSEYFLQFLAHSCIMAKCNSYYFLSEKTLK